jgi:prolipoprotein diacylglyceryltransferase
MNNVTSAGIDFTSLGLDPVALDLGILELRWYSLAYLAGIFLGYWYLLRLIRQPGAPMARRHADDLVFYASLGVILGGRLGYVLFYRPGFYLENALEGILLFAILAFMFWRTRARYQPGMLVGAFLLGYGIFRFGVEFIREPDDHLRGFAEATGLHMGQWLCVPMILGGLYLIATARGRRQRVESFAGQESVA